MSHDNLSTLFLIGFMCLLTVLSAVAYVKVRRELNRQSRKPMSPIISTKEL